LLCNVYLHRLDRMWNVREHGVLARFADDALVMCRSRERAEAALARLRELLAELGLEPKEAKTRIVHLQVGGEGLTFLGFVYHMMRSPARVGKRPITFLARWPSDKAMQHARDRLRELTDRSRFRVPVEMVVREMNWFLNGWAGYFKYGNSGRRFAQLQWYAQMRLGLFLSKRYGRGRRFGRWLVGVRAPARLRLARFATFVYSSDRLPSAMLGMGIYRNSRRFKLSFERFPSATNSANLVFINSPGVAARRMADSRFSITGAPPVTLGLGVYVGNRTARVAGLLHRYQVEAYKEVFVLDVSGGSSVLLDGWRQSDLD
jgi:Group II intron, maturase-specific domain/Reverse transcriptase (RNA-dependent DNA polymerase)